MEGAGKLCLFQPPSGGCVLKHFSLSKGFTATTQPPSGGCVLKQREIERLNKEKPAAFGRLCVDTSATTNSMPIYPVSSLQEAVCSNIVQADHSSFDPSLSEALMKAVEDIRSKL